MPERFSMPELSVKGKETRQTIGRFSLLFVLFFAVCVLPFFVSGRKSLFMEIDGLHQHYAYFLYTGLWIRRLFSNIFVKHVFELPMWDMTIGFGSDPLITIGSATSTVLTDPFFWISAITPRNISEYVFDFLVILKMYFSGVMFCIWARVKGNRMTAILAGALVYTFSGSMYVMFMEMNFLNFFYLFPLLMIGVEYLWTGKGHKLFVISFALCLINSYYYAYMMALQVVVYCVVRYIIERKIIPFKELMKLVGRFFICAVIGGVIGLASQLPAIVNVLSLGRFKYEEDIKIFSLEAGLPVILQMFSIYIVIAGFVGFSSMAIVAFALILRKKSSSHKLAAVLFVIYSLSFFFPIIASAFNVGNYATLRYAFAYPMLAGYILTLGFDELPSLKKKSWMIALIAAFVYLVAIVYFSSGKDGFYSALSLLMSVLLVGAANSIWGERNRKAVTITYFAAILFSCFMIGFACIRVYVVSVSVPFGKVNDIFLYSEGKPLLDEERLTQVRYDRVGADYYGVRVNSSMALAINGCDFYNSNYNEYVDRYLDDMAVVSDSMGHWYTGLRSRGYLLRQNAVESLLVYQGERDSINAPYGYSEVLSDGETALYNSDYDSSIAYFYDDAVNYDTYEALEAFEREELMMNSVVLENPKMNLVDYVASDRSLDCIISDTSGLTIADGVITVTEGNAYIEYELEDVNDGELLVMFKNLAGYPPAPNQTGFQVSVITVSDGKIADSESFFSSNEYAMFFHHKMDWLVTFGQMDQPVDSIRIYFALPGTYYYDDIAIYHRSLENIRETMDTFYEHADMDDVSYEIDGNHIRITASSDTQRYLYLAVPYVEGWSAAIDGEEVDIMRANQAFMAVVFPEGEHVVEFKYETKYLAQTSILSLATAVGYAAYCVVTESKRRKQNLNLKKNTRS
ncbi:MAG: YfhO family protein [Saccharofermentans sp.]|nr:YfhO family protein [Saccharofermentans sp.]